MHWSIAEIREPILAVSLQDSVDRSSLHFVLWVGFSGLIMPAEHPNIERACRITGTVDRPC